MQNFEKRLKYKRYNNMDNVIVIDLHNYYEVVALIGNNEIGEYTVQLMLKQGTVDTWDLIGAADNITFPSNVNIYSAILKTVDTYLREGFFDYYIDRYEYELKCFDIGDEIEERKRLGGIDAKFRL